MVLALNISVLSGTQTKGSSFASSVFVVMEVFSINLDNVALHGLLGGSALEVVIDADDAIIFSEDDR